jgi:glutamine phosphoribosylpyrophosphate amidotransferase
MGETEDVRQRLDFGRRSISRDRGPGGLGLDLDADRLHEECGIFGIFGHPDAAAITALGLHALQHRGQEAAGIVTFDGQRFNSERRLGLVGDHFSKASAIERLPGESAIGHVRYSTTGDTILRNVQPLFAELNAGGFAVAHNGNLTNGLTLRRELVQGGAIYQSDALGCTGVIDASLVYDRIADFTEGPSRRSGHSLGGTHPNARRAI